MIHVGDALAVLRTMPDESVHCCVTSPPYWGLRDYGVVGQLGLEPTFQEYIAKMVEVFREVRRVLRSDGTCWLNIGDSYANDGKWGGSTGGKHVSALHGSGVIGRQKVETGLKPKDLCMIPHRLAIALQEDGWYVRMDIVWAKPNPMPESVQDRPTKSHEYVFLLAKSEKYYFDADAICEPVTGGSHARGNGVNPKAAKWPNAWSAEEGRHDTVGNGRHRPRQNESFSAAVKDLVDTRNKRSVWTIPTEAFNGTHLLVDYVGGDGKPYIRSEDCPIHGLQRGSRTQRRASCGAQPDPLRTGKSGTSNHLDPTPSFESASTQIRDADPRETEGSLEPTTQSIADNRTSYAHADEPQSLHGIEHNQQTAACSSDCYVLQNSETATGNNKRIRKTDHALETTSPCTASAESPYGTPRKSASLDSADSVGHTSESSISPDDLSGSLLAQTQCGSVGNVAQCNCTIANVDHFATFPQALVEPCIKAGCPSGGVVLDPFAGSGTVGVVAERFERQFIGIELNPEYAKMAERRIGNTMPLLSGMGVKLQTPGSPNPGA